MKKNIESKISIYKIPSLLLVFFLSIASLYSCDDSDETSGDNSQTSLTTSTTSAGATTEGDTTESNSTKRDRAKSNDFEVEDPSAPGAEDLEEEEEEEEEEENSDENKDPCIKLQMKIFIPEKDSRGEKFSKMFMYYITDELGFIQKKSSSYYEKFRQKARRKRRSLNLSRKMGKTKYNEITNEIKNVTVLSDKFMVEFEVEDIDDEECKNKKVIIRSIEWVPPTDLKDIFYIASPDLSTGTTNNDNKNILDLSIRGYLIKEKKGAVGKLCYAKNYSKAKSENQINCNFEGKNRIVLMLVGKKKEGIAQKIIDQVRKTDNDLADEILESFDGIKGNEALYKGKGNRKESQENLTENLESLRCNFHSVLNGGKFNVTYMVKDGKRVNYTEVKRFIFKTSEELTNKNFEVVLTGKGKLTGRIDKRSRKQKKGV